MCTAREPPVASRTALVCSVRGYACVRNTHASCTTPASWSSVAAASERRTPRRGTRRPATCTGPTNRTNDHERSHLATCVSNEQPAATTTTTTTQRHQPRPTARPKEPWRCSEYGESCSSWVLCSFVRRRPAVLSPPWQVVQIFGSTSDHFPLVAHPPPGRHRYAHDREDQWPNLPPCSFLAGAAALAARLFFHRSDQVQPERVGLGPPRDS
jgi:hypothetical protein